MQKIFTLVAGCCMLMLSACTSKPADSTSTAATDTATAAKPTPQSEFADPKYTAIGKQGMAQLASGDIDGWMTSFADNAVYRYSAGDSISGKAAITAYWKNRRTKIIDTVSFTNDVWLPIKVNQPQAGPDIKGVWLLAWHQTNVTYKGGKKLVFWVHIDMHFNDNDKIDIVIEYIDRAPIMKALGK
jgi:hypothetical protein